MDLEEAQREAATARSDAEHWREEAKRANREIEVLRRERDTLIARLARHGYWP